MGSGCSSSSHVGQQQPPSQPPQYQRPLQLHSQQVYLQPQFQQYGAYQGPPLQHQSPWPQATVSVAPPVLDEAPFMRTAAPSGLSWAEHTRGVTPQLDPSTGFIVGPWAECIHWGVVFEHTNDWSSIPQYAAHGPVGGILLALERSLQGHPDLRGLMQAADRLEQACHRMANQGQLHGAPVPAASSAAPTGAAATLAAYGITGPLPLQCRMNELVRQLGSESCRTSPEKFLPPELVLRLPSPVISLERISRGWHEGYKVMLGGSPPKSAFCRIWGSQMGYMQLDAHVGFSTERKALEICSAGGVPVPELVTDAQQRTFSGSCDRGSVGLRDFALYKFIEGSLNAEEASRLVGRSGCRNFELQTMIRIHQCTIGPKDQTSPLARFDSYQEHLQYLDSLARSCQANHLCHNISAVKQLFDQAFIPSLPPALLHLDLHMGNILIASNLQLLAGLDWEFACIGDPRFELARHVRRSCRNPHNPQHLPGGQELWDAYSQLRFGGSSVAFLGPMDPWVALESLVLLVFTTVLCTRVAKGQSVPRCDLEEWVTDMGDGLMQLQRLGIRA